MPSVDRDGIARPAKGDKLTYGGETYRIRKVSNPSPPYMAGRPTYEIRSEKTGKTVRNVDGLSMDWTPEKA